MRFLRNALGLLATAATFILALSGSTLAADRKVTVYNGVSATVTTFKVRSGTVSGFSRIAPGKNTTFTVSLPEGQCRAFVEVRFHNGYIDAGTADFCEPSGIGIDYRRPSLQYLPGYQFKAKYGIQ